MTLLVPILLAGVLSITPFTTAAPYNVTLNSTSPMIQYLPSRTGPIAETWNVSYTGSNWAKWTNQTIGQGSSYHYTTYGGATASIVWHGIGAYIYGSAGNGAVSITVDGGMSGLKSAEGILGYVDGLTEGWHNLTLTVDTTGGVNITGAVLTYDLAGPNASFRNDTSIESLWGGNNINAALDTSKGSWEPATLTGGGGGSPQLTYNHIDTHTPGSILTIQPPSNASLVILLGLTNYDHGPYSVTLQEVSDGSAVANQTYSGYSPWIGMDEVLYIGKLDATVTYRVIVQFLGKQMEYWDLGRVLFITASSNSGGGGNGNSGSRGSHVGAIVGGVVGGIVAAAAIVLLVGFLRFGWCRRSKKEQPKSELVDQSPFEIDRYVETTEVSPIGHGPNFEDPQVAYAQAAAGLHPPLSQNYRSSTQITPLLFDTPESERRGSDYSAGEGDGSGEGSTPYPTYTGTMRSSSDEKRPSGSFGGPPRSHSSMSSGTPHQSLRGRPASGLTVTNGATCDSAPHNPFLAAQDKPTPRRRSGPSNGNHNHSRRQEEFTQERDAGRFVMPTEHGGTVPPSYDPAWRQEVEDRGDFRLAEDDYGRDSELGTVSEERRTRDGRTDDGDGEDDHSNPQTYTR